MHDVLSQYKSVLDFIDENTIRINQKNKKRSRSALIHGVIFICLLTMYSMLYIPVKFNFIHSIIGEQFTLVFNVTFIPVLLILFAIGMHHFFYRKFMYLNLIEHTIIRQEKYLGSKKLRREIIIGLTDPDRITIVGILKKRKRKVRHYFCVYIFFNNDKCIKLETFDSYEAAYNFCNEIAAIMVINVEDRTNEDHRHEIDFTDGYNYIVL